MKVKLSKLFKNRLVQNAVSLYAVQICTYVLPVLTFPYLSRVLKPAGWGSVLFAQTIGGIIALIVEYGFELSATREAARLANDKSKLRELVAGVLGAKALLAAVAILGAVLLRPYAERVAPSAALFWASAIWGVGQGINMLWYFQGLQRMSWAGGLDITGRLIATASIFVLVHSPKDGWKVMASQALGASISHAITVFTAYREVGFCWPSFSLIREVLRLGWPMFLFKSSQSLLTGANGLILGFFGSPTAVGLFGGADKIRQLTSQSLWPISQTLFPHQSQRVTENPAEGVKVVRRSLLLLGGLSTSFGIVILIAAPLIVRIVLGPAFMSAVPALRVFSLLIPLTALSTVLSFQWVLPLGFDKQFNYVILTAGVINVILGILFVSKLGVLGMAIAVTVAELYVFFGLDYIVRKRGLSPFGRLKLPQEAEAIESRVVELR